MDDKIISMLLQKLIDKAEGSDTSKIFSSEYDEEETEGTETEEGSEETETEEDTEGTETEEDKEDCGFDPKLVVKLLKG